MDELSMMKDLDGFASLRYTMMASRNPQVWTFSTAGDQTSVVLNQLRERGMNAAVGGTDKITYLEWSAYSEDIHDENNWVASNPALGWTIHEDNIRAVLNDYDLPTILATTILAATFVVIANLLVDILYAYIDPRVRVAS